MAFTHPDFGHIEVRNGVAGENPEAGKFYAAKKGDTLSTVIQYLVKTGQMQVARIFDGLMKLNNSVWNRANCKYREDSANCSSKRVTKGGFIALCQADQNKTAAELGLKYPVIWIPSTEYAEPTDVPAGPTLWLGRTVKLNTSSVHTLTPEELARNRAKAAMAASDEDSSYTYRGADNGANASTPAASSSSYLPWVIGGIVIAAGAIFYATTRTDGRKKRR